MRMKRLKEHRRARGLSQDGLARAAHVSSPFVAAHERGLPRNTHIDVAVRLATVLDIPVMELFAAEDIKALQINTEANSTYADRIEASA
ncbi:helix-turn-helix transcriptional regulator [Deinococcus rubellus]|uniref:Helix-turn-helix domain-containing protein n=1 Tax=Deinococcus rubellus TaxID=1889240 RepID=A0ABY5YF72_9DEIO|nr:helix-turn-helix transcriptional regulator [Deinococcus rubellus]UWX62742.1 helix-turn-helix domain-containing protein [Deinococcus rubellus]